MNLTNTQAMKIARASIALEHARDGIMLARGMLCEVPDANIGDKELQDLELHVRALMERVQDIEMTLVDADNENARKPMFPFERAAR